MKWNDENLIFLVSMPRSGSTLLQRVLVNQPEVASTAESWLLLPQFHALKEGESFATYSHTAASRAITDFCDNLPDKKSSYMDSLKTMLLTNFSNVAGNGESLYLEKTPRNNLILPELVAMFPNAKYVFLWRNPAAIIASMIDSFAGGKWNIYRQEIDIYQGYENMLNSFELNIKHRFDLKYEDFVSDSEKYSHELFEFLGLVHTVDVAGFNDVKLKGRMGDPTGIKEYSSISTRSLDKWKKTFSNPLRKRWIKLYITSINERKLSRVGYSKNDILKDIIQIKLNYKYIFSDLFRMLYGVLDRNFQLTIVRRLYSASKGNRKYMLQ